MATATKPRKPQTRKPANRPADYRHTATHLRGRQPATKAKKRGNIAGPKGHTIELFAVFAIEEDGKEELLEVVSLWRDAVEHSRMYGSSDGSAKVVRPLGKFTLTLPAAEQPAITPAK